MLGRADDVIDAGEGVCGPGGRSAPRPRPGCGRPSCSRGTPESGQEWPQWWPCGGPYAVGRPGRPPSNGGLRESFDPAWSELAQWSARTTGSSRRAKRWRRVDRLPARHGSPTAVQRPRCSPRSRERALVRVRAWAR
ncbi:hypothetical protein QJS66_19040 [Kocuria rhizophila]|nr:hypothetical protein QJS66_19040 [Kocuria rhizophila]